MIKNINTPRILIAAPSSHSGKTVITCALLKCFKNLGLNITAFKAGADYIDPDFLRMAGNCEVRNLDLWLMKKNYVLKLFFDTAKNSDLSIIEGVMGLFDGGDYSAAELAKTLKAPVILVVNVSSSGESVAALVSGFKNYDPNINLAGVILNFAGSNSHVNIISNALKNIHVPVLGFLMREKSLILPERHLGLVQADEIQNFNPAVNPENFKLNAILDIAKSAPKIKFDTPEFKSTRLNSKSKIKIAVAHDKAFSFYYPESLETLKKFGAELKFFSPLANERLPQNIKAVIFGGGYPEIYASELEKNYALKDDLHNPDLIIFAECGGFMFLCDSITNFEGEKFYMAGLINADCVMNKRAVLGYVEAESLNQNILCDKNKKFQAHEFHFSEICPKFDNQKFAFKITRKSTGDFKFGGYFCKNILASYLHINFFGNPDLAERFIFSCRA